MTCLFLPPGPPRFSWCCWLPRIARKNLAALRPPSCQPGLCGFRLPPPPVVLHFLYPLRVLVFCSLSPTGMVANDTGSLKSQGLGSLVFSSLHTPSPALSLFLSLSLQAHSHFPSVPQASFTFSLVPLGREPLYLSRLAPASHHCCVDSEDLLKVVFGALPGTWLGARQRCQSFRASHCRLAQVSRPDAW